MTARVFQGFNQSIFLTWLKNVLLICAMLCAVPLRAATVLGVSPEGEVRSVRQVTVRFDTDMTALGQASAAPPASLQCTPATPAGQGRWVGPRVWSFDFAQDLSAGMYCSVVFRKDIKALDGTALDAPPLSSFFTGPPRFSILFPYPFANQPILENQTFVLKYEGPSPMPSKASLAAGFSCELPEDPKIQSYPVALATDEKASATEKGFAAMYPQALILSLRCSHPLPTLSKVRLRYSQAGASPQDFDYRVRLPFTANFKCTNVDYPKDQSGCDPRRPVNLHFSSAVDKSAAELAQLVDSQGKSWKWQAEGSQVEWMNSPVPSFDEAASITLRLPPNLRDVDGRQLANASDFPMRVTFASLPPYLGAANPFAIMPWHANGIEPAASFAVRHVEKSLNVQHWRAGGEMGPGIEAYTLALLQDQFAGVEAKSSLSKRLGAPAMLNLATHGGAMEFVSTPALSEPGLHIVRADSPLYAKYLGDSQKPGGIFQGTPRERYAMVQVTNLNPLASLSEVGASMIWVTALDNARPVADAEVAIYSCEQVLLWRGKTNADGLVSTGNALSGKLSCGRYYRYGTPNTPWMVVRSGRDMVAMPVSAPGWVQTTAAWGAQPYKAHIVLDRTLFKAGETVHMEHFVRLLTDQGFSLPPATSLNVEIGRGYRDKVEDLSIELDAAGNSTSSWVIPADAKLGTYFVVLSQGNNELARTSFQVEEFRTPVFDVRLDTDAHWKDATQSTLSKGHIDYFSGGSAEGLPVNIRQHYLAQIRDPVPGYSFYGAASEEPASLPSEPEPVEGKLDRRGNVEMQNQVPPLARPLLLQTDMRFQDPNGETQTSSATTMLWPDKLKLGMRSVVQGNGKPMVIEGVALNQQDQPVATETISLRVKPVRSERSGNQNRIVDLGPEITLCDTRTDTQGRWRCDWQQPPSDGDKAPQEWLFTASADSLKSSLKPVRVSLLASRWTLGWQQVNDRNALQLENGPAFMPGDVAVVIAKPERLPATLLLSTEREGVVAASVHALTQTGQRVELPLKAQFAPNVHLAARYVYPLEGAAKDAPLASTQGGDIEVAPTAYRLQVNVRPAKTAARPREQVPVEVSVHDADGKAVAGAHIILVAVDQALLALKPNASWALAGGMLARRTNHVHANTLDGKFAREVSAGPQPVYIPANEFERNGMDYLAYPAPVVPAPALSYAGGAEGPAGPQPRNDLKSLILWRTDLLSNDAGLAHATLPLNDALTQFRIVAIVTAGADRFGEAEASITSSLPLQLFSGLPQLLRSDDTIVQKVSVRNTSAAAMDITLRAEASVKTANDMLDRHVRIAPEVLLARGLKLERRLKLAAGQMQEVLWPLAVPDNAEALNWRFEASGGKNSDVLEVSQRIIAAVPVTVRQATLVGVRGTVTLPVAQPDGALPLSGGVRVALQDSLANAALSEPRRWMTSYPYNCLEQQSSRFVALNNRAGWDSLMTDLPKYLDAQGLARFFPESSLGGSEMLTMHVLDLAHAMDWPLPDVLRNQMLDSLERLMNGRLAAQDWAPDNNILPRQLAAQATLAEYGRAALAVQPDDLNKLSAQSLIDWTRALLSMPASVERDHNIKLAGEQLRSRYDVQGTRMRWRDEAGQQWWWFMWSGDSTAARAALLAQQLATGDASWKEAAPLITQGLVGRQVNGRWSTTSGNAWGVLALRQFQKQEEAGTVTGHTTVSLAGNSQQVSWNPQADASLPSVQNLLLPWPAQGARAVLSLKQDGGGKPWATVSTLAAVRQQQAITNGLTVTRTVSAVEQKHKGQWSVGDVYRVRLDMESTAAQTWVVVRDAVPSGATQLGRGLGRESSLALQGETGGGWTWPSYVERATDSYRAYFRWVPRGRWHVDYTVRLNNAGELKLPPVRIEAMYAPEVYGEGVAQEMKVNP